MMTGRVIFLVSLKMTEVNDIKGIVIKEKNHRSVNKPGGRSICDGLNIPFTLLIFEVYNKMLGGAYTIVDQK